MRKTIKVVVVAGARPNFMKIAPIYHSLVARKGEAASLGLDLSVQIVHTGQHYDSTMSDVFFTDLGLPAPDRHLEVGSGTHAEQTARVMMAFEKVVLEERPDVVVVVGDVNSTIACALTSKKLGVPVAHVEAGLRSFDMGMPEEINRKLTDAISDFLFVTEESGIRNLRNEGVPQGRIFMVGNVMIDTLLRNLVRIENGSVTPSTAVRTHCPVGSRYAVLTLHRPSNVDDRESMIPLWDAIRRVAREIPIIFPVHPRTRSRIAEYDLDTGEIALIEPIGYIDMLYAVKGATMVLTDSGGLQEETTVLGVPCITIRENTERPVTVEIGTNYLVGTNPDAIVSTALLVLLGKSKHGTIPPLWDGKASERISDIILKCFIDR